MASIQDSEGLQVNDAASKAPEVALWGEQKQFYSPPQYYNQPSSPRGPFGLGIWSFGILVATITAIIVGGGVGGGLGAALANCQKGENCSAEAAEAVVSPSSTIVSDSPSETTTTTSAFYSPTPATKVENLTLTCPEEEGTSKSYRTSNGYKFEWYCGTDAPGFTAAEEGGVIVDMAPIIAYSLGDCLLACANMLEKDERQSTGLKCRSVVYSRAMSQAMEQHGANCWLKNGTKKRGDIWVYDQPNFAYAESVD